MEEIINRKDIDDDIYREILDKETHHNHTIVKINDVLRWKENPYVLDLKNKMNFNDIVMLFHFMGYDKNSEPLRKLYRDIGMSLFGYWEVFYWEANNEYAHKYKTPLDKKFSVKEMISAYNKLSEKSAANFLNKLKTK